jgi:hypothetical protein
MLFHKERRLFFKRDRGVAQKTMQIIMLGGFLLFVGSAHFFDAELATQHGSKHEQTMSKLGFAPQGVEPYQTDKTGKDRQIILTRVSVEAPLTGYPPNATSANLLIVSPEKDVRGGGDALDRFCVINHAQPDYSSTGSFISGVNMPGSKKPPDLVEAVRVQRDGPYSATSSSLANEPSKTELTTMVKVDQDFDKARLQPKAAKSRRISVRSRRSRAVTRRKRSRNRTSPPTPNWADQYFQN